MAAGGRAPETQKESDWVDDRWQKTEVGPFLASSIKLPNGWIAKGLSIRLRGTGATDEAAVVYDTLSCVMRGAWMGKFLKFSPSRYGLTDAPAPQGLLLFQNANDAMWSFDARPVPFRHRSIHLRGERVVVEYEVGDVTVKESPSLAHRGARMCLVRSFEAGAASKVLEVPILRGDRTLSSSEKWMGIETAGTQVWAAIFGDESAVLRSRGPDLLLTLSPSTQTRHFELRLFTELTEPLRLIEMEVQKSVPVESVGELLAGPDRRRWGGEIELAGKRGSDRESLAVDEITVPYDNPWNALFFLSGVDVAPSGEAYLCSIHGDVWRVRGIDDALGQVRWKRFATGLFQPLGLKLVQGRVCVLGRDQITRLIDTDGDGEADRYENVSNAIATSTGGHDYVTNLEVDDRGNYYYVDPRGVHRITPDGLSDRLIATGWRNPNGLGLGPNGTLTVSPQQGTWTPSSAIFEVAEGGYYGFGGPKPASSRPLGYDAPLCWIPHNVDNSSSSQVWVPEGAWGPFSGGMLHLVWGRCTMMRVLRDAQGGVTQGAVTPLPARFISGPMRGRFHEGALYVAGCTGWQTSALKDGSFERVRFTGKPVRSPLALRVHRDGVWMKFSEPLEGTTALDPGSYALKRWNYRYSADYGSKDYSVSDPTREGRDEVAVQSVRLSEDRTSLFLATQALDSVMQMELKYNLNMLGGESARSSVWFTVNQPREALGSKAP